MIPGHGPLRPRASHLPKQDRLLDRLRDRGTDAAAGLPGTADSFEALIGEEFALLVTFRRSGAPVPTPVWFGMHDGRLYVESLADAGKVKRLRHDRRVGSLRAPFAANRKARSPMAWAESSRQRRSRTPS